MGEGAGLGSSVDTAKQKWKKLAISFTLFFVLLNSGTIVDTQGLMVHGWTHSVDVVKQNKKIHPFFSTCSRHPHR
jgi:hypothetical protein